MHRLRLESLIDKNSRKAFNKYLDYIRGIREVWDGLGRNVHYIYDLDSVDDLLYSSAWN